MNLIVAQDEDDFNRQATDWLKNKLEKSQQKLVQLPAGQTPISLYQYWEKNKPDFLLSAFFHPVDDILTGPKAGYFSNFFKQYLPSYKSQFHLLNENPQPPSLAMLGIGPNGHVAFHEPEVHPSLNYGCVLLSDETKTNLNLTENTWGLTYGLAHFMKCHSLLLIARGNSKKNIIAQALEKKSNLPISEILNNHKNCTLLVDKEAWKLST